MMRIPNRKRIREYLDNMARKRRQKLREIDIEMVWEPLKLNSPDLETARQAFRLHAMIDEAWSDLSDAEILEIVNGLE